MSEHEVLLPMGREYGDTRKAPKVGNLPRHWRRFEHFDVWIWLMLKDCADTWKFLGIDDPAEQTANYLQIDWFTASSVSYIGCDVGDGTCLVESDILIEIPYFENEEGKLIEFERCDLIDLSKAGIAQIFDTLQSRLSDPPNELQLIHNG